MTISENINYLLGAVDVFANPPYLLFKKVNYVSSKISKIVSFFFMVYTFFIFFKKMEVFILNTNMTIID